MDARVEDHGSIFVVQPLSQAADSWLEDNVWGDSPEEHTWWAGGLVVEPRYVEELVAGMIGDGLEVS